MLLVLDEGGLAARTVEVSLATLNALIRVCRNHHSLAQACRGGRGISALGRLWDIVPRILC